MKKIIDETDTGEHFKFLDFVSYEEISDIYRMADVLVLPSYPIMTWQEQFGMVLAEAMASGMPVISTSSGSIPEAVGDAAVLIPAGNYKTLADTIIKFMENKSLRENCSQKGRGRAERLFNIDKIANEFSNVLKEILL